MMRFRDRVLGATLGTCLKLLASPGLKTSLIVLDGRVKPGHDVGGSISETW
jgi:hypothetical protein